jgi:hypothetical protein
MSNYNDYERFVHQMQTFRASDEAREHFVSVRVAESRVRPCDKR